MFSHIEQSDHLSKKVHSFYSWNIINGHVLIVRSPYNSWEKSSKRKENNQVRTLGFFLHQKITSTSSSFWSLFVTLGSPFSPFYSLIKIKKKPPCPLLFLRSFDFSFQFSDSYQPLRENHIFLMPFPSSPSLSSPLFSLSIKWPKIHISCISFL